MAWEAIYETATGRLISVGSVVADPLPAGLSSVVLAARPTISIEMWDEATTSFIARPPKVIVDRLQDLLTRPAFADFVALVWSNLNPSQRTRVRTVFINWLGRARWRAESESEVLEPDDA